LSGKKIVSAEYGFVTKDKARRLGEVSATPLLRDGEVIAVVGVVRDVTEQRQLEKQLIQAQKMESIGRLAGGIAHDFNNLLGGMLGYASLMKTKLERDDKFFEYVETIEKSATRAAELTSQLLAFSRGGKYETDAINLNKLVREAFQIIDRTIDKSIEIETRLSDMLPAVDADAGQIEQAIMNLVINARDAMPGGGKMIVETSVARLTEEYSQTHMGAKPGLYVVLTLTDTGVGMDKDTAERAFEPFFTTKEDGKGTGLGLAMVYGVVKNHGGHVWVYSEPEEGTTFKVYLPTDGKRQAEEQKSRTLSDSGGNELILVVDDEESMRAVAKDMLIDNGYRVLQAEDGIRAVEIFGRHNGDIDLVILDMVMPKLGGMETFLKLKELSPNVKALLSTGYSQGGKAQEILKSGVHGFVQKPYDVATLLSKVRSVLDSPPPA
jgi:signal transduction histidine kinase